MAETFAKSIVNSSRLHSSSQGLQSLDENTRRVLLPLLEEIRTLKQQVRSLQATLRQWRAVDNDLEGISGTRTVHDGAAADKVVTLDRGRVTAWEE